MIEVTNVAYIIYQRQSLDAAHICICIIKYRSTLLRKIKVDDAEIQRYENQYLIHLISS